MLERLLERAGVLLALTAVLTAGIGAASEPAEGPVTARAITLPSHDIEVVSQTGGVVEEVLIEEGQSVRKGQPLVKLDSTVQKAVVAVSKHRADSRAQIESAQAQLTAARGAYQRTRKLHGRDVASEADLEKVEAELHKAESALKAAREQQKLYELQAARDRAVLERMTVRAPLSGIVVERLCDVGEAAQQYQPVARLVVLDPLHVIAHVSPEVASALRAGCEARLFLDGDPDRSYQPGLLVVDPVVDAGSGTCRVKLSLPNAEGKLASGLRGRVVFERPPSGASE